MDELIQEARIITDILGSMQCEATLLFERLHALGATLREVEMQTFWVLARPVDPCKLILSPPTPQVGQGAGAPEGANVFFF